MFCTCCLLWWGCWVSYSVCCHGEDARCLNPFVVMVMMLLNVYWLTGWILIEWIPHIDCYSEGAGCFTPVCCDERWVFYSCGLLWWTMGVLLLLFVMMNYRCFTPVVCYDERWVFYSCLLWWTMGVLLMLFVMMNDGCFTLVCYDEWWVFYSCLFWWTIGVWLLLFVMTNDGCFAPAVCYCRQELVRVIFI